MKKSKLLSLGKSAKLKSSSEVASPIIKGVKYQMEFIADQSFRGTFYAKGEKITVGEPVYKAYKDGRSNIVWTKLS